MNNGTNFDPDCILTWEKSPTYAGKRATTPGNYHAIIARDNTLTFTACGLNYSTYDAPQSPDPLIKCRNCEVAIGRQRIRKQKAQRIAQNRREVAR